MLPFESLSFHRFIMLIGRKGLIRFEMIRYLATKIGFNRSKYRLYIVFLRYATTDTTIYSFGLSYQWNICRRPRPEQGTGIRWQQRKCHPFPGKQGSDQADGRQPRAIRFPCARARQHENLPAQTGRHRISVRASPLSGGDLIMEPFIKVKTALITIALSAFIQLTLGQNVNFEWANKLGGAGSDRGYSIAVDAFGNVFTTGHFVGTVDFDPGPDSLNLTSAGLDDVFISKIDALGNLVWARQLGGADFDNGLGISLDGLGNLYIIGAFRGTSDFDPGVNTFSMASAGNTDIFICKLDESGDFIWARNMGGTSDDIGHSIAVDASGNVYATGPFQGTADFDPSAGTVNLTATSTDIYICKLDFSGNLLWVKQISGVTNSPNRVISLDSFGNVLTTGSFGGTVDFDPGIGTFILTPEGGIDIFIAKFDSSGNFVFAKNIGGTSNDFGASIFADNLGNVYTTGVFGGVADFDPGVGGFYLTSAGLGDVFVSKLNALGNFVWGRSFGGASNEYGYCIAADDFGNVYTTGYFGGASDFDPGAATYSLTPIGWDDIYVSKLDSAGNFLWVKQSGGLGKDIGFSLALDASGNVYTTGYFSGTADFDPGIGVYELTSFGGSDIFLQKLTPRPTVSVFNDVNINCVRENEIGVAGIVVNLQPLNLVAIAGGNGIAVFDSIPDGTYGISVDTTNLNWSPSCQTTQIMTVVSGTSICDGIGMVNDNPCTSPNISIAMPNLRRGFTRTIYVRACNDNTGTGILDSAYLELTLPSELQVQSASIPYISLGGNRFSVFVGDLNPGQCVNFTMQATVGLQSLNGQTLCLEAELFPQATCVFDSVPTPYGDSTVTPCTLPWDKSSLRVEGSCVNNDSIRFVIYNTGDPVDGDMDCWAPVRIYVDGVLTILDSIRITGGDSVVYMFAGDGRTWRLEADQHPLHPGNSHPNASVENCGSGTWTPNIVNQLPQDDADPVVDIFCGVVTAPMDPNDKTGFPLGVGAQNIIRPGQQMEYLVRFQNTGTDTAFTVIIRDTLDPSLSVFSVTSGVASHPYNFRMYGPRVLEWTFDNIQLPDSNVDEPNSHGFVKFMVDMEPGTPLGTVINNTAAIYFDFEAPVITNTTMHTVGVFELPTSSEHAVLGEMDIAVYPNPTTGILKVVHDGSAPLNLRLVDPLGRVLKAFSSESAQIQLDLSSYSDGIYHLVLSKGDSVLVKKVVKR